MNRNFLSSKAVVFLAGLVLGAVPVAVWAVLSRDPDAALPPAPPHAVHRDPPPAGDPSAPAPAGSDRIRVYFDGVHGARHLYNRDNRRYRTDYHTVSGWYRLLQGLRTAGYSVEPEDFACFDEATLENYDVFMVGEETYHARFMTGPEREALRAWVKKGGGLFITAEHTNAHYMGDVFNGIVEGMPIAARFDSICDTTTADPSSPDWVTFPNVAKHPVTEGVVDYAFDNGCSLDTPFGVLSSSDTSWSDRYDPTDKPVHNGNKERDDGELAGPLAGVAAFEYGEGRVVVIGDHNALTNTSLYIGDHHRLAMNAVRWLARAEARPELVDWQYPTGYDLFVHTGAGSAFDLHKKADRGSYRTAYGFWSKEPQLRPWAGRTLRAGDELLVLGAPTVAYTDAELETLDRALASGEPVLWAATLASLGSPAGRQLQERFGFQVRRQKDPELTETRPYEIHGPEEWTHGLFRTFVPPRIPQVHVEGLEPIVQLTWGSFHVEDEAWERDGVRIDLVSAKDVGPGRLYVMAPFDLFDDQGLAQLYVEGADVARQQMAELVLRTAKIAMHDPTVFAD